MLPTCPTGYGDSPYQSYSTFAGNPYFIDLDELEKQGLLEKTEYQNIDWESGPESINYGVLYEKRYGVLEKAVERFLKNPTKQFYDFCGGNAFWLEDYAKFMSEKDNLTCSCLLIITVDRALPTGKSFSTFSFGSGRN